MLDSNEYYEVYILKLKSIKIKISRLSVYFNILNKENSLIIQLINFALINTETYHLPFLQIKKNYHEISC